MPCRIRLLCDLQNTIGRGGAGGRRPSPPPRGRATWLQALCTANRAVVLAPAGDRVVVTLNTTVPGQGGAQRGGACPVAMPEDSVDFFHRDFLRRPFPLHRPPGCGGSDGRPPAPQQRPSRVRGHPPHGPAAFFPVAPVLTKILFLFFEGHFSPHRCRGIQRSDDAKVTLPNVVVTHSPQLRSCALRAQVIGQVRDAPSVPTGARDPVRDLAPLDGMVSPARNSTVPRRTLPPP